jgi:hypothetical protein
MPTLVTEAAGAKSLTGSRQEITLITPGWGSSGYYSAEVLEAAAKGKVFPKGTQMHIDHMSEAERYDSPAGSIKTLAAALEADARWDANWADPDTGVKGRLVSEARVFGHWKETLAEMKDAIGVSIAAAAEGSIGEAEGRQGRIIEALLPSKLNRVDFVTIPGRGGRISEVLESFRAEEARNIGMWLEARMHSMFTNIADEMFGDGRMTREERITLSGALGQALSSFTSTVEAEAPQLFERDLWDDPTPTAASEAASTSSPPNPAGAIEGKEATVPTIQIEESVHADLVEKSSRATALEAALKEANDKLAAAEAEGRNAKAEAIVAEAFGDLEAKVTRRSLVSAALAAKEFDADALKADAEEAAAEIRAAQGEGSVRGVGHTQEAEQKPAAGLTVEAAREAILAGRGYTPKGA